MAFRRWRRKVRCLVKHGPRGCPHIERHSRRPRRRGQQLEDDSGRHLPPVTIIDPADLVR